MIWTTISMKFNPLARLHSCYWETVNAIQRLWCPLPTSQAQKNMQTRKIEHKSTKDQQLFVTHEFWKKLDVARPTLGIQLRFQQGKMVTSLDHSRYLSSASLCHLTIQIDQVANNGDKLYGFLLRIFFSVLEGEVLINVLIVATILMKTRATFYCKQFTHQINCVLYVSFRDKGLLPVAG